MSIRRWQPPDDDDLSEVVTRVFGVRRITRRRLANDSRTKAILAAGMRLLDAQFAAPASESDSDEVQRRYPFFQWLSRRKIAEEVAADQHEGGATDLDTSVESTIKLMERRWPAHDHFLQDFLNYAMRARHWSLHVALSQDARELLIQGLRSGDFPTAVHEVAYEDLSIPMELPGSLRVQLLATVLAEREPEFREIVRELYGAVDIGWTALYTELFAERGWKLRPDVSFQDLNLMLSTAAEGMALRALIDPTGIIYEKSRTSLLGKLALVIMLTCVDSGDGMGVEQIARKFTTD